MSARLPTPGVDLEVPFCHLNQGFGKVVTDLGKGLSLFDSLTTYLDVRFHLPSLRLLPESLTTWDPVGS